MSRARRKTRLSHKINAAAMATGLAGVIASAILRYPLGIALGVLAAALGAIGMYITRRKS